MPKLCRYCGATLEASKCTNPLCAGAGQQATRPAYTATSDSSDVEDWKSSRTAGSESIWKFLLQSWGGAIVPACVAVLLARNDQRLDPAIKLTIAVVGVLIIGGIIGLIRWSLNERRFKLAERLGRVPTQADQFGKAGAVNIPNHYVYIGFAVVVVLCIAFLLVTVLLNQS